MKKVELEILQKMLVHKNKGLFSPADLFNAIGGGKREKEITGEAFKKNREFWKKKLIENRKRDTQNNRALRRSGWSVQRFWDTDILKKPDKVINRLRRIINETIG